MENMTRGIKERLEERIKKDHADLIRKFSKAFDHKSVLKAKSSLIYLMFIIIFVTMIKR